MSSYPLFLFPLLQNLPILKSTMVKTSTVSYFSFEWLAVEEAQAVKKRFLKFERLHVEGRTDYSRKSKRREAASNSYMVLEVERQTDRTDIYKTLATYNPRTEKLLSVTEGLSILALFINYRKESKKTITMTSVYM